MWPASTSTTMPSGSLRPSLTIVFKSEPSGLQESTRPALTSKTNRRPEVAFVVTLEDVDFAALEDIEFTCSFFEINLQKQKLSATFRKDRLSKWVIQTRLNR